MGVEKYEQLQADIKAAMKAREKDKLTALRMLHSELKNVSVNAGKDLTEEDFVTVVSRAIKQRKEAIEQYRQGERDDLVAKEEAEVELFQSYLPEALERDELEGIVRQAIEEAGAVGKKDMGKVMKVVMPQVKGRADGKQVNQLVLELLG